MRHADNEAVNSVLVRFINETLHGRNKNFATLKTETLLRRKLLGKEVFEPIMKTRIEPGKEMKYHGLTWRDETANEAKIDVSFSIL